MVEFLLPVLGNLGFLPIISTLLNVFVCDESIGDGFDESFLAKDCYEFCWKDFHLIYALASIVGLLVYEPLAVYARPFW